MYGAIYMESRSKIFLVLKCTFLYHNDLSSRGGFSSVNLSCRRILPDSFRHFTHNNIALAASPPPPCASNFILRSGKVGSTEHFYCYADIIFRLLWKTRNFIIPLRPIWTWRMIEKRATYFSVFFIFVRFVLIGFCFYLYWRIRILFN